MKVKKYNGSDDDLLLLEELVKEKLYESSEKSLYEFYKNFWHTHDPAQLHSSWVQECICEHVQAALERKIRRLTISIPPRSGKTVAKGTEVLMADGSSQSIENIKVDDEVLSFNIVSKEHEIKKVINWWDEGLKLFYEVTLSEGQTVLCTKDHRLYTSLGYRHLRDLKIGDDVSIAKNYQNKLYKSQHDRHVREAGGFRNEEYWCEITDIREVGYLDGYDIEVEDNNNFVLANGIHSHNSTIALTAAVWNWLKHPDEKYWFLSHSAKLFIQNILLCRRILEHPSFKERWMSPDNKHYKFKLRDDQNTKGRIDNTASGYLLGGSPSGKVLGLGYTVALLDDILDSEESRNDIAVEKVNSFYTGTFMNRSNDVNNDVIIILMQRLRSNDIINYVNETYSEQDWFNLVLPAKYAPTRTFISPIGYNDKRKTRNELLDPIRLPEDFLLAQSKNPIVYNTRYQQDPQAGGIGNFILREWIQKTVDIPRKYDKIVTVWDLTFDELANDSYTAGTVVGKYESKYYILDMIHGKMDIIAQVNAIRRLKEKYKESVIAVEKRANGSAAMTFLKRELLNVEPLEPRHFGGSKEQRMASVLDYFSNKLVYIFDDTLLPNGHQWHEPELEYDVELILKELTSFPLGTFKDICDTVAYAISYLAVYGQGSEAMITGGKRITIADEDYYSSLEKYEKGENISDYMLVFSNNQLPSKSDILTMDW